MTADREGTCEEDRRTVSTRCPGLGHRSGRWNPVYRRVVAGALVLLALAVVGSSLAAAAATGPGGWSPEDIGRPSPVAGVPEQVDDRRRVVIDAMRSGSGDPVDETPGSSAEPVECPPHPPINITGDVGFLRPDSGVVGGTGTEDDPYVIAGWCIRAEDWNGTPAESPWGIQIHSTRAHVVIRDNVVSGFPGALLVDRVAHGTVAVEDNTIHHNEEVGLGFVQASGSRVERNVVRENGGEGILVGLSHVVHLLDNTVVDNDEEGIRLVWSRGDTLVGNELRHNGLRVWGTLKEDYRHDIDSSNTADGQPIRYLYSADGATVTEPAGQVIVAGSTNVSVDGVHVTGMDPGVHIAFSQNVSVTDADLARNGNGVLASRTDSSVVADSEIHDNRRSGVLFTGGLRGFDLTAARDNTVRDNTIRDNGGPGIGLRRSDRATVRGNDLDSNRRGVLVTNNSAENTITDNTIHDNDETGVHLYDGNRNDVRANVIQSNAADGIYLMLSDNNSIQDNVLLDNGGGGIQTSASPNVTIEGNAIRRNTYGLGIGGLGPDSVVADNTIAGSDGYGLRVISHRNRLQDNDIHDNDGRGVILARTGGNVLSRNDVHDNGAGVRIEQFSSDNTLLANTIYANRGRGVSIVHSDRNEIRSNTVRDNSVGVRIKATVGAHSKDNAVLHNNITRNGKAGVLVSGPVEGDTVHHNNIVGHKTGVSREPALFSDASTDARHNWWGCPDGPDHPDCDGVSGDVTYTPWRTEPNPDAGAG